MKKVHGRITCAYDKYSLNNTAHNLLILLDQNIHLLISFILVHFSPSTFKFQAWYADRSIYAVCTEYYPIDASAVEDITRDSTSY